MLPAKRYFKRTSRVNSVKVSDKSSVGCFGFGMNLGPKPRSCLVPGGILDLEQRLWKVRFLISAK